MSTQTDDTYRVGPGDKLRIIVLGQADLTETYEVDTEGRLDFPFLEKVRAQGLTVAELEQRLAGSLADGYLRHPRVSVSVVESYRSRVFVAGEVRRPGPYPLGRERSLAALLGRVGELTDDVGHEVVVVRPPTPEEAPGSQDPPASLAGLPGAVPGARVFRVSLRGLLSGHPEKSIALQPGDTVWFPKAASVYVIGHAARPGAFRYEEGLTVHRLLALAGGPSDRGSSKLKIARIVEGKRLELKVKATDVVLPEDTLIVPERFF